MINLSNIENMVAEIPNHKIENLITYLKGKNPSSLSTIDIQEDLKLTSNETNITKKIFKEIKDGNLLSITIQAILNKQLDENQIDTKLVITAPGKLQNSLTDHTHETIYQMIHRAKKSITIIGYWVYEMSDFFKTLSMLQDAKQNLEIKFILDSAPKWKMKIEKEWNKKHLPKVFKVDKNIIKTLHAKIIIVDDTEILVTSANLTINAMEKNIEAGIWSCNKNIVKAAIEAFNDFEKRTIIEEVKKRIY